MITNQDPVENTERDGGMTVRQELEHSSQLTGAPTHTNRGTTDTRDWGLAPRDPGGREGEHQERIGARLPSIQA